jgi:tetratricopeptide (TPR) repeat protein
MVRLGCVISLTLLAAAAAPALAQEPSNEEAAEAKFKAGKQAYRLGDYDDAIAQWKEAYRLKDNPAFLFNIAQAYREKGDLPKAVLFFENYLKESPTAPNRAEVQKRVDELKKLIEDQKASAQRPPMGPVDPTMDPTAPVRPTGPASPTTAEPQPAPDRPPPSLPVGPEPAARPGRGMRIAGLATGGAGLALIATGVVFGLQASSTQDEVEDAVAKGAVWSQELDDKDASGRRAAMLSNVTFGIGAAAVVGGGVLYFLGQRAGRAESSTQVSLTPTATGWNVALGGRF